MRNFVIQKLDTAIAPLLQTKIDSLAKPKGSLGLLEQLALQIGTIQQSLTPQLSHPCHILLAADHGIAESGVSPSPKAITWQQALNFVNGGGGINIFTRQHGFQLMVVDVGVDYDFEENTGLIDRKISKGTANFLHQAAMSHTQMEQAINIGISLVDQCHQAGCNIISLGELGIANTSPSSIWMSYLTGIDLKQCVGAGSGWASEGTLRKYQVLKQAVENYQGDGSAEDIMRYFGGYEMVAAVGAMLRAAELGMIILIDGFIMTNCLLMASQFQENIMDYAIFGHQGEETGHKLLLDHIGVNALLQLHFRLGEGTGAVCAFPLVDSAVRMINEMKTFQGADISPITKC
ncbi:nicotinate-nucleotide--dimethylbenzimidazole phosphoribosyltransferase [Gammaproteobacteria bacterium ESL0073]|nr:nicotinate-nucleotide--dimethylbenzimidazole phosphoribosyltransferase [Gammaproteobacteria bacterium ESL0073]